MAEMRRLGRVAFLGGIDERGDGSAVGGRLSGDCAVGLGNASEGEHLCLLKYAIVRSVRELRSVTFLSPEHSLLA
jgi:hypothetical protein